MVGFYVQLIIVAVAWGLLVVASALACVKHRRPASGLQLGGSTAFFVACLMNFLRLYGADASGRIQPAWLWEVHGWMMVCGVALFAIGCLWFWMEYRRN
jgi:hypothetical protein